MNAPEFTHIAPSGKPVLVLYVTKYGQFAMSNGAILPPEVLAKWQKIETKESEA
jgi:hypothetical protein